ETFRQCCEAFERSRDNAALSSVGAELGESLYRQGRHDEAERWADLAETHAPPGDLVTQFTWRSLRAKLLAIAGDLAEAERVGAHALDLVRGTDALVATGDVLLDTAEVQLCAGRPDEATSALREALSLYERKGSTASAAAAKLQFDALVVA
ncbi:MAG: tetratricopeptide repeat protein, partial [Actinomycetota bacterium]|nr:tetratricopeptide repeat protein [Actinomycetota bacterium]